MIIIIGQNAHCSRDIHLQFKKLPRTVILLVIIYRRTGSTYLIGRYAHAAMLISMEEAGNTNNGYWLLLFSLKLEIPLNEPKQMQGFFKSFIYL